MLEHFLKTTFSLEGSFDYESVQRVLKNPNFPNREAEFKKELAHTILNNAISIKKFEDLTDIDYDSLEEINKYLRTEIWQPLYGDEPIQP